MFLMAPSRAAVECATDAALGLALLDNSRLKAARQALTSEREGHRRAGSAYENPRQVAAWS